MKTNTLVKFPSVLSGEVRTEGRYRAPMRGHTATHPLPGGITGYCYSLLIIMAIGYDELSTLQGMRRQI